MVPSQIGCNILFRYSHVKREEAGIDPNRDFPYDQNPDHCSNFFFDFIPETDYVRIYPFENKKF